jgi:hypothetical protein
MKLVEVSRANGEAAARVIMGLLESSGIPAVLRSNAAPSIHVFAVDGMGEFIIMVDESRAEEARALLKEEDNQGV